MKNVKILFGKPGAGKGTRFGALEDRDRFEQISVGNLLRAAVKNGTELGRQAKSFMESGALVPDSLITNLVIEAIESSDKNDLVLDGFPRTVGQAHAMLAAGILPSMVLVLELPDEVIIQRSRYRVVCPQCGQPYTLNDFHPPKVAGICDDCGAELIRRKDDEETVVRHRLNVFSTETFPVLQVLTDAGIAVHTIDNTQPDAGKQFAELMHQ